MSDLADGPVVFKRKPKPSQRARERSPTEEGASEDVENSQDLPVMPAVQLKLLKSKRTKVKSKLSFGGEDEEGDRELFQVKKSSLSLKVSSRTSDNTAVAQVSTSKPSTGPVYDQAHLAELKAGTFISESTIQSAKEKRRKLRQTGAIASDEFIPLTVSKRDTEFDEPHPESRLMREEDELGEGDDEFAEYTSALERIALGKKARKVEASQRREAMLESIDDVEEEDEDFKEWAEEQERRGGHKVEVSTAALAPLTYKPAPIPSVTSVPMLGPAITRLSQTLSNLTVSHASHSRTMVDFAEEHARADLRETELREMIEMEEEKRSWFAAFRDWAENVATFLDEKFSLLENLEDVHVSIIKERYDMVSKRRQADDEDDLVTFMGSISKPEDELGRTRISHRVHRGPGGQTRSAEDEGYSTDSSLSPSDAADYSMAMQKLIADGEGILADVKADDFIDPRLGMVKWFREWRSKYDESYMRAWGGLGLVVVWEFWMRLELLGWDPIGDARSLSSFTWYSSLYDYSRPRVDQEEEQDDTADPELGPEGDLAPEAVSTFFLPRLSKIVDAGALDPYSEKAVRRMVDLAKQVEASVGQKTLKFQPLLRSVFATFEREVTSSIELVQPYLAMCTPKFNPEAIPARRRFLRRRIKFLKNLVHWRTYTGEQFGLGPLAERLVNNCMLPVGESGWEVGGKEEMQKVSALLPPEMIPSQLRSRLN